MRNKSLNSEFYNSSKHEEHQPFLEQMDEIITDLEQTFVKLQNKKEDIMTNKTLNNVASNTVSNCNAFYVEKPNSEENLIRKAFLDYIAQGNFDYDAKSHLLSRDESSGGYLVPTSTFEHIDARLRHLCPLRSLAKVSTIRSESLELLIDKSSMDAGWMLTDELSLDGSTPDLMKLRIQAHPLYAKPKASQKILDDVGNSLEEWIIAQITQKVAALENNAFLHGDGDRKPKGILSYEFVKIGDGQWEKIECVKTGEINRNCLLEIVTALKSEYLPNATWLMSRSALTAVQQITDSLGHFLWQSPLALSVPSCLLGYPVVISDDMPAITDESVHVPILFGDFSSAYQIVDRGEISVLRDPYSSKPYVEFYATKRVGGDMVDFDALKALSIEKQ
ncbi:MAG: phage major capsid protein [Holosporales bacterium]|jgi:HK97 family phage major capsid protein|nr:phage major capsid protein [Holosporales bacterium]